MLIKKCGNNWYADLALINRANEKCIFYLQKTVMDYLKVIKKNSTIDFVENHTTFGYWVAIIESGNFWNDEDIKIKTLFSKKDTINPMLLKHKDICKKLKGINDLRNYISHQNRIIGRKIKRKQTEGYSLIEIYNNTEWIMGDLYCNGFECCPGNTFKTLYNEYDFICQSEIKIQN